MKKKKKVISLTFLLCFCLMSYSAVRADNAGGTGGGSGGGGSTGNNVGYMYDAGPNVESGAYKFEFIYNPKGSSSRELIKCAVVNTSYSKLISKSTITGWAWDYANNNNCVYIDSGPMAALAARLNGNRETIDDIFNNNRLEDENLIRSYMDQLGVSESDKRLKRPHDYSTGHYESYGYRILIQKFTVFMSNGSFSGMKTRKEYANQGAEDTQLFGGARAIDIHTTVDDIRIRNARGTNVASQGAGTLFSKFKDWNNGAGYNILWLAIKPAPQVDYTVDAACVDCKDEETDQNRASYVVQDSTNWEGILRSDDEDYICNAATTSQKNNIMSYYSKKTSCGTIYCREEVKVVFPNSKNTVTAERGRYFTVHSPFRDDNKEVVKPYDPTYNESVAILNETKYDHNWGAITIQKTKECRMANASNEQNCLNANGDNLSFKKTPQVELTYKGTDNEHEYESELTNLKLDVEPAGEYGSKTASTKSVNYSRYSNKNGDLTSNYIYRNVQTSTYKLPGTTYRYVLKEGGVFTTKTPEEGTYIDLGIATVPVSAKNKIYTDSDATLSLRFRLDDNMHLSKAFQSKENNFLPTCYDSQSDEITNIYKYVKSKGSVSSTGVSGISDAQKRDELANSACAKLYLCTQTGSGISCRKKGVDSCINNRTNNKLGNTDSTNCFVLNNKDDNGNSNYVCPVLVEPGLPDIPDIPEPDCPECPPDVPDIPNPDVPICVIPIPGTDVCLPPTGYNKLIYRPIDLDSNAFPGRNGGGRKTGANWCGYNYTLKTWTCSSSSDNPVVKNFIYNNRGVKGSSVYNLTPMYTVNLDRNMIKTINGYNSGTTYDDFNLTCNKKGQECISRFVGTHAIKNCNNFGTCAGG